VILNEFSDANLNALAAAGFRQELGVAEIRTAQGWIPADQVNELAAVPCVQKIETPHYGITRCMGSKCSEGDLIQKADQIRALGFDGSGVKVGVISDGVHSIANSIASGDLPANVVINPSQGSSTGDEGTAMLEIVHDLAPGAKLYFSGGTSTSALPTSAEMISGINWLRTQGVQIIVDDIGFFSEPFFEDGSVALAVRQAVTAGVIYCSAAGNDCKKHYQGQFRPGTNVGGSITHNFSSNATMDDLLNISVPAFASVVVIIQWDDPWGSSSNDYDARLVSFSSLTYVAFSEQIQDGNDIPREVINWTNFSPVPAEVGLEIRNYLGQAASRQIEVFCLTHVITDDDANCADSIFGHPAVSGVISCGAINASNPGNLDIAPYSSQGPSTITFPFPETRQTPFASAIDGVTIFGSGGFPSPFFGTSAAAPHAAAMCALLMDAVGPTATPTQIRDALRDGAQDRGTAGFDTTYGRGLLDVLAAYDIVCPRPIPTEFEVTSDALCGSLQAKWQATPGAMSYVVSRKGPADGAFVDIATVTEALFEDTSVDPCSLYAYQVSSIGPCGRSVPSVIRDSLVCLPAPTGLTVTQASRCDGVLLTWTASKGNSGYIIQRAAPGELQLSQIGLTSATSFLDGTADPEVVYSYAVRADGACGPSSIPDLLSGSRGPIKPATPADVIATDEDPVDQVRISWSPVPGALDYRVWRSETDDISMASEIALTTQTSYADASVKEGQVAYYWVKSLSEKP